MVGAPVDRGRAVGEDALKPSSISDLFERAELQEAYQFGFDQEYDYDSLVLLYRLGWLLDEAGSSAAGAEGMAAMLDGAADALHALARRCREDLPTLRALDRAS